MEAIYSGLSELANLIVWPYAVIFILLSWLIKENFEELLNKITPFEWKTVYTVLTLATILAIPYLIFVDVEWQDMLLTYTIGTTFWELIMKRIVSLFNGK